MGKVGCSIANNVKQCSVGQRCATWTSGMPSGSGVDLGLRGGFHYTKSNPYMSGQVSSGLMHGDVCKAIAQVWVWKDADRFWVWKKTMHTGIGMRNHEEFVLSASNARAMAAQRNSNQRNCDSNQRNCKHTNSKIRADKKCKFSLSVHHAQQKTP